MGVNRLIRPGPGPQQGPSRPETVDRKSTRLNSSHGYISYAVFCLKKKKYSAYEEIVEAEFVRLLTDAHSPWADARNAVRHRLGAIPVRGGYWPIPAVCTHRDPCND